MKISFGSVESLTLLFVIFKLTGVISWHWWWVVSPVWIGVALVIGAVLAERLGRK